MTLPELPAEASDWIRQEDEKKSKSWVPYSGPRGGFGWRNSETDEVIYQDNPPGELVSVEDMDVEQMGEALSALIGEEEAIDTFESADSEEEVRNLLRDEMEELEDGAASHSRDESGETEASSDPPDRIADFGVDWRETDRGSYGYGDEKAPYPILSEEQREQFRSEMADRHGWNAVVDHDKWVDSWKTTSYTDQARTRALTFKKAAGIEADARNHELQGREPTEEEVGVAKDLMVASQHFVEEHLTDEDGKVEVHRGISQRHGNHLKTDVFATFAEGESMDSIELEMNAMENYSAERDVAARWGRKTATITEKIDPREVMVATDLVQTNGTEGEVSIQGGSRTLDTENIDIDDEWSPSELLESNPDSEVVEKAVDTAEGILDQMEHHLEHGNALPYDEKAAKGIEKLAEVYEEDATDDRERREQAAEDLANLFDSRFDLNESLDRALSEVGGGTAQAAVSLPLITDMEELASEVPDELTDSLSLEEANEVLEIVTGEEYNLEDGHKLAKVEELKQRVQSMRESDSEYKADGDRERGEYDLKNDRESLDWIALSREERRDQKSKSWVPYEGPQGGQGWVNTDTEEIIYQDEPPGEIDTESLTDEEEEQLRQYLEEQGVDPDVYMEEQDWQPGSEPGYPPFEELEDGDMMLLYDGVVRWVESKGDDTIGIADEFGSLGTMTREEYEDAALEISERPEEFDEIFDDGTSKGTPVQATRSGKEIRDTIEKVQGNWVIFGASGGIKVSPSGDAVKYHDGRFVAPVGNAVNRGADWYHSEHGELEYVDSAEEFGEYEFEKENGEIVTLNATDDEEMYYAVEIEAIDEVEVGEIDIPDDVKNKVTDVVNEAIQRNDFAVAEIEEYTGRRSPAATYSYADSTISINPDEFQEEKIRSMGEQGYLAGDSVEHVALHEVSHGMHAQHVTEKFEEESDDTNIAEFEIKQDFDSNEDQELAERVSVYAKTNPSEFVAEVGALLLAGKDVDEEVLEMYEKYGGMPVEELEAIQ